MSGDGAQNHIPYSFWRGNVAAGTTDVTFPAGLDAVIRHFSGRLNSGASGGYLLVKDGAGNILDGLSLTNDSNVSGDPQSKYCYIVIPAGTNLQLTSTGASIAVDVSGDLVVPESADVVPSLV